MRKAVEAVGAGVKPLLRHKRDLLGATLVLATLALGWMTDQEGGRDPQGQETPQVVINSLGMEFRLIPGGSFQMGSLTGQPDEQPPHRVTLSPFYMAVHEVTQGGYEALMGENPSQFPGPTLPVESVDWFEASDFCARLSQREGQVYRLPTEAEWEYAARGEEEDWEYTWGDVRPSLTDGGEPGNIADDAFLTGFPEAASEAAYVRGYDDGYTTTAPVGSFPPNRFGLFDMTGNVFEWCSDRYELGTQYYRKSPVLNPQGPAIGEDRVLRGGSWWAGQERHYRVASRFRDSPALKAEAVGFRCVREVS